MQIGFGLPISGSWAAPANLLRVARRAEELGYASLWTFQRLLYPEGTRLPPVYASVHDPVVPLAYVAAVTERVRLGTAIINMPFQPPVLLAKQLASLDVLSGGRLDAGLGLGWSAEEFAAAGVPADHRGARAEEYLRCLQTIWSEETVAFDGDFYQVPASRVAPKPVQRPGPPVLLGGIADPALRRIGRLADGWISVSTSDLTALERSVTTIKEAATAAGRDPDALRFVCRGVVKVRPAGADDRTPLTGSLEEIRADLPGIAAQGMTELFVDLNFDPEVGSPDVDAAAAMRRAEEALEAFAPEG